MLCIVFSRISIVLTFALLSHTRIALTSTWALAATAQQQTSLIPQTRSSFPEQDVNDCHNCNDLGNDVVCHYNKHLLLLIMIVGTISTVVLLSLLLKTDIVLALIILKTMILLL